MTEEELGAIKEMHSNALNIWHDRMFEEPHNAIIEVVLRYMPAGTLLEIIGQIEADIAESLAEEGGEDD